ncbi:MAG: formate dehydrogenase subunit gamma [Burkholderiaceae bacterium]
MKKVLANLAFATGLCLCFGAAAAQTTAAAPSAPVAAPAQAAPSAPNVESVDFLKQNQAERSQVQPGNLAPTWRAVKDGEAHYSSLPGPEMGVFIQGKAQFLGQERATTAGEAWRQYRNGPLTNIAGWLLVGAVVLMAIVYFVVGKIRLKEPKTGRVIQRFTPFERILHWTVAISFVALAVSGLIMLFGRYIVLPLFGHTLFGWLAYASKNIHNFVGPLFTVSSIVMGIVFLKDNLPRLVDLKWLTSLGGLLSKKHVSSGRFNAGEKLWFWGGVIFLGLIMSASGFVLDMLVPNLLYTRGTMQTAHVVHLVAGALIMAASLGHIYMGTVGMEGAYDAMRHGYVDDTWAKEHHELWYEDVVSGKVPRVRKPEDEAPALATPRPAQPT